MSELIDLIAQIKRAAEDEDDEKAHGLEDRMRNLALEMIEKEPPSSDCSAIARLALSTNEIRFARWCA